MWTYFKLIRPSHWVKNLFLLIPPFFAGTLFHSADYSKLFWGFISFSFAASSIYILNDIKDKDVDKYHPKNKYRPIASGLANIKISIVIMIILASISFSIAFKLSNSFFIILLIYFGINLGYSLGLKNISIIDILIVATGFLLRVYSGGVLSQVSISHWLAIMIFLLALFLTLAKRRDDLVLNKGGDVLRKVSKHYNLEFINSCLSLFAGIIIVSYIMYTLSAEVVDRWNSEWLFATTFFVITGILRYLQITFVDEKSGSPTTVLIKDKFIIINLLFWILTFYLIIYDK